MFKKFAKFWIENPKLTWLFIIATLSIGVFSWFTIPKQYNPDIVVPSFQIDVSAPGFSNIQTYQLVTKPLENIVSGLEGVDHVYGYSTANMASVLVSFHVGVDKEAATTRLHNALTANVSHVPMSITNWNIQSIDPDDIPIFSFAVYYDEPIGGEYDVTQVQRKLRVIALELIDTLKTVKNTSIWLTQGGQSEQVSVIFDIDALQARNIDVLQIIDAIQKQQLNLPIGSMKIADTQAIISLDAAQDSLSSLENIVVANYEGLPIYLNDVATIRWGEDSFVPTTWYAEGTNMYETVFVGAAKKKGSNAVSVTKDLKETLETVSSTLPEGFSIAVIQDEGKIAEGTTNMLLINLVQSILIVLVILSIFLGGYKALNVAITIPLTLSVVFFFILVVGDNINRITLFALILVLGMLVDDATVVVENVNRHLSLRNKTNRTMKESIIDALSEVELGVVLSTVTRLLAFIAMFFVTGMMGEYMGPIPKYAIVTMITSTIIALSINPFLAYTFEQYTGKRKISLEWFKKISTYFSVKRQEFGGRYKQWLKSYLEPEAINKRKKFKRIFWILLALCVILPIYFEVFRARMLPKSDQQQIYLRMDTSRDSNIETTKKITQDVQDFLNDYLSSSNSVDTDDVSIIKEISRWVGLPPMVDFSNLFRGSQSRGFPYQISARINLIDSGDRHISSEEFVFTLRESLQKFLHETHPGVEMRLLEDPPGPPTRATFLMEMSSNEIEYERLIDESKRLQKKLFSVLDAYDIKDIGISDDGWQTEYVVKLDHQLLAQSGLTTQQVGMTLAGLYHGMDVALVYDDVHLEPITIHVNGNKQQLGSEDIFSRILLTNNNGERIPLTEVAEVIPQQYGQSIYSDDRTQTVYMYGEMGSNSVVYPILGLYKMFDNEDFWEGKYEYLGGDFYGFDLKNTISGESLRINLGGERELTMDTFRDMGLAMIIAFIAIYITLVIQFGAFDLAGVIMISFLLGFFGVFPGYMLLYLTGGDYFSATSMIGVIALAGIVVGNAILLIEYALILLKRGNTVKMSLVHAGRTRMKPILITSLTTILGATTILGDPVWSGVARAIILGLTTSALLTTVVLPIFLYDGLNENV